MKRLPSPPSTASSISSARDKIQDPDLIYPQQDFEVEKTVPTSEVETAKKLASETGKYKEHKKPRKKLPIYF